MPEDIRSIQELIPRPARTDQMILATVVKVYPVTHTEVLYDVETQVPATGKKITIRRVRESVPSHYPNHFAVRALGEQALVYKLSRTFWAIIADMRNPTQQADGSVPVIHNTSKARFQIGEDGTIMAWGSAGVAISDNQVDIQNEAVRLKLTDSLVISTPDIGMRRTARAAWEVYDPTLTESNEDFTVLGCGSRGLPHI